MSAAKQRRAARRAGALADLPRAELVAMVEERNEELDRRTRERNKLEHERAGLRVTIDCERTRADSAEGRARALDCRVADLEEATRLQAEEVRTLREDREAAERGRLEALEMFDELVNLAADYGHDPDGETLSDWLRSTLAEERDAAKLRRRLHERTRERDEARTRAARAERKTMA